MRILSPSERFTRTEPGQHNYELMYEGRLVTGNSSIRTSDGRYPYFDSNACYKLDVSSLVTADNNTGSGLVSQLSIVIWVDKLGTPTITYFSPNVGTFGGPTITTVFDPLLNRHRLDVNIYPFGNGSLTSWGVSIKVLEVIRP